MGTAADSVDDTDHLHSAFRYYVVVAGRRAGPIDAKSLKDVELHRDAWVWREGLSDWQRAEDVAEVAGLLRSLPPPFPTPAAASTDACERLKSDFRRATPFIVAALLCYFATAPVLAALTGFGTVGKVASFLVAELPVRLCGAAMAFYFARGLGLPLPIGWSVPSLVHPVFTLITGPALAYLAQKRLKQAGVPMGFFGPLA